MVSKASFGNSWGRTRSRVTFFSFSIGAAIASSSSGGTVMGWSSGTKRLEAGTFEQLDPSTSAGRNSGEAGTELSATELALLLTGVDLASARRRKRYARAG
jgi:hypothetical protein